ncbi:uncharacterized protein [Oscarella lobularis]|uniref:uncharacterized protein isoform X4 n=1 Tax=Oscarella lobularis TaxID=121494 RepID=UPI0033137B1E
MGEERGVPSLASLCGPIALFRAIRSGDHSEVKRVLGERASVDSRGPLEDTDNFEVTALHLACWLRKEEIAALLIDRKADIESRSESGSTPLFYACKFGLVPIVKKLVEKQCNVQLRNKYRVTALHFGCESGNVEICSILLDNEAVLEAADENEKTPLHWACEWNKLDAVKLLFNRGANIEAKDDWKKTPFLVSCRSGNVEIMNYLVEKGCDMKAENKAALHLACSGGKTEAMDWLLSKGFDYCDIGKWGWTTLHCACEGGHLEISKMLVTEHGLDLEHRTENGMTPFLSAVISGNVELVKWLQEKDCKMSVRNQWGNSALHLALEYSKEEVFFYLIENFFDECNVNVGLGSTAIETSPKRNIFGLESMNNDGETLFLVACKTGLQKIVEFLYEKGCNWRAKDNNGKSGLHLSCENGHTSTAEYLMKECGLDPEETDDMNETSLMKACRGGDVTTAKALLKARKCDLLTKNKDCVTALHFGCKSGNVEICSILLDSEALLEAADKNEKTPLHWACKWNKLDAVKLLTNRNRGANIEAKDDWKTTPFLVSCECGNVEIMNYLVEKGCDTKAENKAGAGALHLACSGGKTEAMDWLLSKGFNYCDIGKWGWTTLHMACEGGHLEISKMLVTERGLDLEQRAENGMTPFLSAVRSGNVELVKWLQEKGCKMSVRNQWGNSALHLALNKSKEEVFFYLIENFFDECNVNVGLGSTAIETSPKRNILESMNNDGETLFLVACKTGLQKIVEFLYKKGCNWRAKDNNGKSGLHLSCENGHTSTAEYLMKECGLDPEETDDIMETSLMKACRGGHVITVKTLLQVRKWDLLTKNEAGENALHLACKHRHGAKVAHCLIDFGISVNDEDNSGWTPLMNACRSGLLSIVHLLAKSDVSLNQKTRRDQSLLHLACANGHDGISQFLINRGVITDEEDKNFFTPLAYACQSGLLVVVKRLVKMGCSLKYKKWDNNSLLHLTCSKGGHVHVVKYLVKSGADFNEKNGSGETPLMLASAQGFFSVVTYLSSVGSCDSSFVLMSEKSMSPLHYACKNGHKNVADFLISNIISDDVYLDKPDKDKKTPLVYAYENGMLSVVEQLESRGCSLDVDEALLTSVCQSGSIAIVNRIIERNEKIVRDVWKYFRKACEKNRVDVAIFLLRRFDELLSEDGRDALLVACQNGCLCVINHLVKRGFSLTQKTSNENGLIHVSCKSNHSNVIHYLLDLEVQCDDTNEDAYTPLMIATEKGNLPVVQRLLELGCSLESKSKNGKRLLHLACENRRASVAHLLLDAGAALNDVDKTGESVLRTACRRNLLSVVTRLADSGCSLEEKTKSGESLLHVACKNRHASMVHLLLDAGATANEVDETGESVLRTACRRNLLSAVTRLADSGCSLEEKTKQEETLLHAAGGKDVAEFLTSKVDVMLNALDLNGNTPLTAACRNRKVDVALYLQESGCSTNQRNKFGESPFSWFLECCSNVRHPNLEHIKRFISAGAEISSMSTRSEVNVLHLAARTYDNENFCLFFLNEGADPSGRDKSGKLPYEYASGNARRILREAWVTRQYSKLKELGETKPSKIKVCLIGAAGAGKTTLMNSLRRKQLEEALSSVSEVHVDESSDPSLRTAGIDIIATTIDEAGDVVFCDFAGQPNFHKTHSLFFSESTTIYLLVVNLEEPDEELYSSSLYWLRLTKCSIGSSTNNSVVIIGSRGDKTDGCRVLRRLRTSLKSKFEEFFDFSSEPFILDCRLSTSAGMQNLRKVISELKTKSIEKAPGIFSIIESIQSTLLQRLRDISKQSFPLRALKEAKLLPEFLRVRRGDDNVSHLSYIFLRTRYLTFPFEEEEDDFGDFPSLKEQIKTVHCRQFVLKDFFCLLVDSNVYSGLAKDTLYQFVQFLHGIGEIIEFGDNIILDPPWLCHNVIGPLMSPETFPVCLEAIDDGAVSAERIEKFGNLLSSCRRTKRLSISRSHNRKTSGRILEKDENMIVYVGRRLQCKDETDIIVPGTIPFLQTRSVVRLDPSPQIWKDGMVLEKQIDEMTTVEGLIELQETARAIDVVARGPVDSEAECWGFVKDMLEMVRKVLDDRSPGTIIDHELRLSTSALKKLVERPPAHKPSLIESAISNDSLVSTKAKMEKYADTLRDLLIVPSDHYCLLPRKVKIGLRKCLNLPRGRLNALGEELGLRASDVITCTDSENILRIWNNRRDALVSKLVNCLRKCDLLAAMYVLHCDVPFVQLLNDEALAAKEAFSKVADISEHKVDANREPRHVIDDSKSLPLEDQVVEERHIDCLEKEVFDCVDDLQKFTVHLLGWTSTRAKQYLNDCFGQTIATKFFNVTKKWTDIKGTDATMGKLLEAFEKVEKKGAALKVLSQLK